MIKNFVESLTKCHDAFEFIAYILIPVTIMVINIWLVNKNTNKQIKNQNEQTYKPRLRLSEVEYIMENDCREKYFYFGVSRFAKKVNQKSIINVKVLYNILNIGYGIANNIKFYSLIDGEKCFRSQSILEEQNQKMTSTDEIAANEKYSFYFNLAISKDFNPEENENDFFLMVCDYEDLNKNHYKVMLGLIIKKVFVDDDGNYKIIFDHYYYHEGTNEYNRMIKKHNKKYKTVISKITKEQTKL